MTSLILNAAVKATPLLMLAWLATALLRRSSADLRHKVWLAAFFGTLALMIPAPVPEVAQIPVTFTFVSDAVATPTARQFPWATIWATGAAIMLLRFFVGIWQLARITRDARPTDTADVRNSPTIASPLTWGVIRPTILLPAYATDWSPMSLGIALQHERAHIDRGDWLWQSAAQLVNAIFWFHPLVWFASARLRQEAEHAVDDLVVASGAGAASYAQQLIEVARHVRTASPISAIAMVRQPSLTTRITAILDATRIRTKAGLHSRVAIAITAVCLVPVLAALQEKSAEAVRPTMSKLAESITGSDAATNSGVRAGGDTTRASLDAWNQQQASLKVVIDGGQQSYQSAPTPTPQPNAAPQATPAPQPATPEPQANPTPADDSQAPFRIGAGVSGPVVVYKAEPVYTEEGRRLKVQGSVTLSVVVDEFGVAQDVSVTAGIGSGLDEQAVASVKQWRFTPGMKNGVAVPVVASIVINFRLL